MCFRGTVVAIVKAWPDESGAPLTLQGDDIMKSKTLVAVAVASTIGWSAASFAGASHEVITPFSPNESGEVIFQYKPGFASSDEHMALGGLSDQGTGTIRGSYGTPSSSNVGSGFSDETASVTMDESLAAANEGFYTDYYLVGLTPVESWDYYIIDNGGSPELVSLGDVDFWMPTHELALIPSETDEMVYELTLVPTYDTFVLWTDGDMSGEAMGE
jgi:hypothetical protein